MKSWQRWGMRALALAMLLSLTAGPLVAGPRGGASDGEEYRDNIDSPNPDMLSGDPDGGVGGRANPVAGDLRMQLSSFIQSWFSGGAVVAVPALLVRSLRTSQIIPSSNTRSAR